MNSTSADQKSSLSLSTKIYLTVFGLLAFLTILTVGMAYLHLDRTKAITIALLIAGFKVSLIASFFMHLKSEGKLIHGIFYAALFFVLILLFLVLPDIGIR